MPSRCKRFPGEPSAGTALGQLFIASTDEDVYSRADLAPTLELVLGAPSVQCPALEQDESMLAMALPKLGIVLKDLDKEVTTPEALDVLGDRLNWLIEVHFKEIGERVLIQLEE